MQHHPVFQSRHDISGRDDVYQDRVSGHNPVECLSVGGLYLLFDIDGFQLLLTRLITGNNPASTPVSISQPELWPMAVTRRTWKAASK